MSSGAVAVIGAGWAGMAAAVELVRRGHATCVFEAARTLGGRARGLEVALPDGTCTALDNGQHILIGAYRDSLALMREVGVDPATHLLRLPLALRFPDGLGLALPDWPAPLDAFAGILRARGWSARDKAALLKAALSWRLAGFRCAPGATVAELCRTLTPRVLAELIEPLCVSALNTPADEASAQVFLRVLHDALFAESGGSHLLLPRVDLGRLFPVAAGQWIEARGAQVHVGHRVQALSRTADGWLVDGQPFAHVVLACPPWESERLVAASGIEAAEWLAHTRGLRFTAITTVYAQGGRGLPLPMLALRSTPQAPAQFVFDRAQLGGPAGLLAFVVSASTTDRSALEDAVRAQAAAQLQIADLRIVQTVVEKRATFACTPGLARPASAIAPRLWACGDYVQGPYPATLEGAVRSGRAVAERMG